MTGPRMATAVIKPNEILCVPVTLYTYMHTWHMSGSSQETVLGHLYDPVNCSVYVYSTRINVTERKSALPEISVPSRPTTP